ncbi:hypothetical protein [Streptomyces sp. NPDC003023]|uniref:hypothetical protein n=1 Tax=Streptomyces sp. NPDC003023 TaxID=3364675 RepID=UPI00369CABD7
MRASRALAATVTAFAAVGLCAPMAAAGGGNGPRNVQVSPSSVHQGGILTITVDGCHRGGVVSSNAFPDATLSSRDKDSRGDRDDRAAAGGDRGDRGDQGNQGDRGDRGDRGDNAGRGGESVATARVRNNATPGNYSLTVKCNDNPQTATASFRVLPGRAAQGGLGGSIGPTDAEMAIGAGLVATAAVGGSLFIARRRRSVGGPA